MTASIHIGTLKSGGLSNTTGIFSGQNLQNDWDAHSQAITSLGTMMGRGNVQGALWAALWWNAVVGQPVLDEDIKANGGIVVMGEAVGPQA